MIQQGGSLSQAIRASGLVISSVLSITASQSFGEISYNRLSNTQIIGFLYTYGGLLVFENWAAYCISLVESIWFDRTIISSLTSTYQEENDAMILIEK